MRIVEQSADLIGLMNPFFNLGEEVLGCHGNPEYLIERAGRVCYKSEDRITATSSTEFIRKLNKLQHHSVLEHSCASIRIVTDRGISHELVRHRLASYSMESTRYVNYSKEKHGGGDIQFILPIDLLPEQKERVLESYRLAEYGYNEAIKSGCTQQQARDLLPNGLKTELVMTCNFREWLHFLKLRTAPAAHPKMQVLARLIQDILVEVAPTVFNPQEGT